MNATQKQNRKAKAAGGYDDDTDPDGTPGGGLPREDITPKILEAVRAMNGNFNEPDHPRHADGKFATKDQGGSGNISIKGNELAGFLLRGKN